MNQGKLDVVKQEMARVNIDILGISELKWMGMGEFNSESESHSVVSDPISWNSPGQNPGVSSLSLLQGIFQTQG